MKHKIHRRFFISYFADACRYVGAADDTEKEVKTRADQENRAMYVRSAILHCALALEAAANACLDVLGPAAIDEAFSPHDHSPPLIPAI
jgi:hypothetical protein